MTVNQGRKNGRYAVEIAGKHVAPSATTVLGAAVAKPNLSWGAAKESATFAVDHLRELARMPREAAHNRVRLAHKVTWDAKRDRGTAVHDMAADWAAGRDVDCPPDCAGYLDALEAFYADHQPVWVEVERCVINATQVYGGAFDAIATIGGRNVLIDVKTGGRYPIETTMQLAAYRYAEGMGVYDDAGELVAIEPMPAIEGAAVLYLHGDGTYELLELPADLDAFAGFLAALAVYRVLAALGRWERAHPAPVAADPVVIGVRSMGAPNVAALVA